MGVEVEVRVVEKALPGSEADAALPHVALDDLGGGVALAAERLREIAAGIVENVAAAPVDELEHPEHGEAEAEAVLDRLVDFLGRGDPPPHPPRRPLPPPPPHPPPHLARP